MKRIKENIILNNKFFKISNDIILNKNNSMGEHLRIEPKQNIGIAVLPILKDGSIIFQKQYRYSINQDIFQVVKGGSFEKTNPEDIMLEELEEELGLTSSNYIMVGDGHETPSIINQKTYLFIAYDCEFLKKSNKSVSPEEIFSDKIIVTKNELIKMIDDNVFKCFTSQALVLRYLKESGI